MPREHGLTLIELMVTLVVAAILITVAVPGFGSLVAEQRLVTATNQFVTALHLTRSEAVKRGGRVTLCASEDGQTCESSVGYTGGWIVFVGPEPGAALAPAGEVIRVFPSSQALGIEGNGTMAGYISFVGTGETRQLSNALQMGTVTICGGDHARRIVISRTGRPRIEQASC
jgi:type IV fimbrial biogenesis protein FimT